jgi:hypothetical protein
LAIIEYLDTLVPSPRLIPDSPVIAAMVRAVALTIACEIHPLNNLRVLNYLKGQLQQPQESVDAWMKYWMLNGGLDAVEALLPGDDFCFGGTPTLADCCLIPQLFNANRFKISYAHLPKICRVERSCIALQSFSTAHPSVQTDAEQTTFSSVKLYLGPQLRVTILIYSTNGRPIHRTGKGIFIVLVSVGSASNRSEFQHHYRFLARAREKTIRNNT